MAQIPICKETAEVIGPHADKVDNRSLLFDKYPLPKVDTSGNKFDEASRWSLMRIAYAGSEMLEADAKNKSKDAEGKRTEEKNRPIYRAQANMARTMSKAASSPEDIPSVRQRHALRMWSLIEQSYPENHGCFQARLGGRLAINLADGIIENAGMCLDRIFGEPMIPASALKGIARNCALWDVRKTADINQRKQKLKLLTGVFGFGDNELKADGAFCWALGGDETEFRSFMNSLKMDACKGGVSFLPAHPVSEEARVVVDLTNVHYPDYYRSGSIGDLRNEKLKPNAFPAVEAGTYFNFLFLLNDNGQKNPLHKHLLQAAGVWLKKALTQNGVGAKTAAGYGWFVLAKPDDPVIKQLFEIKSKGGH